MISSTSHAKCIISGEHSVIRGGKAIAFPIKNFKNTVNFSYNDNLVVHDSRDLQSKFIMLLHTACDYIKRPYKHCVGTYLIQTTIPRKSGLGSSAAICANIASIFQQIGLYNDVFSLARHLENIFHKNSSGLDIAVSIANSGIVFENNTITKKIDTNFMPHILLTYSGQKSKTSDCVNKIQNLFQENRKFAEKLDELMNNASNLCEKAFFESDIQLLKDGLMLGYEVFQKWGLCNAELNQHIDDLIKNGAIAAKPTGSGLGGYVISLWGTTPPKNINGILLNHR